MLKVIAVAALSSLGVLVTGVGADAGTPTFVSPFSCIVTNGGSVTRPAGSAIVVRQLIAEQTRGIEQDYIKNQTTMFSLGGAPLADVSDQWTTPSQVDLGLPSLVWASTFTRDTEVTLANPGDSMSFNFSLSLKSAVPEIFNPAIDGEPGQPTFNGPGVQVAGTCTVTAR
jgi:hypothetical protein